MKLLKFNQAGVILSVLFFVFLPIKAKMKVELGTNYTSEIQSDFGSGLKWVGFMQNNLNIYFPHKNKREGSEITIELITIYSTSATRLANDQQTFSNIEGPDLLLSPFLMGYTYHFKNHKIFAGFRNVNEDYFTTDYTSLFTQSSAGIHPVLSANFELANYPQTGLAVFLETNPSSCLRMRSSVYNGVSGSFFKGENNPFGFNYQNNGLFLMHDMLLTKTGLRYNIGVLAHLSGNRQKRGGALWGLVEKAIYSTNSMELGVVADASYAFMSAPQCSYYWSLGFVADGLLGKKAKSIISSRLFCAHFRKGKEFDLELNWLYQINSSLRIQPAIHLLHTDKFRPILICRGIFTF